MVNMNINLDYVVKYKVLPGRHIFNPIGPDNTLSIWKPRKEYKSKYLEINPFYTKLEESVLSEGFRNPILIVAGTIYEGKLTQYPEEWLDDKTKAIVCSRNGGSRLWVAQKHNLDIPCIVAQYNNVFPDCKPLKSMDEIYKYYTDKPKDIKLTEYGIKVYNLPQVHLRKE